MVQSISENVHVIIYYHVSLVIFTVSGQCAFVFYSHCPSYTVLFVGLGQYLIAALPAAEPLGVI